MFDLSSKFHLNESNGTRDIASQTNRQTDRQRNCKIVVYEKLKITSFGQKSGRE